MQLDTAIAFASRAGRKMSIVEEVEAQSAAGHVIDQDMTLVSC